MYILPSLTVLKPASPLLVGLLMDGGSWRLPMGLCGWLSMMRFTDICEAGDCGCDNCDIGSCVVAKVMARLDFYQIKAK